MEKVKDQGDEVLYNTLDSAYPTDNDSEVCLFLLDIFLLFLYLLSADLTSCSYCFFLWLQDENSDTYEAYDQDSDVEDEDDIMASDEYLEGDISNGIQVQESEVEYETI